MAHLVSNNSVESDTEIKLFQIKSTASISHLFNQAQIQAPIRTGKNKPWKSLFAQSSLPISQNRGEKLLTQ
jgi:hypothetical protein